MYQLSAAEGGDVVLMDDGTNRPGCNDGDDDGSDDTGCFSRAARYRLDHALGVAELVWQFEFPIQVPSS